MEAAQNDQQSEQDEQQQQQQERLELKEAMVHEHQLQQHHQKGGDASTSSRKIFIGGLSYATDDEKLRSYFARYGQVLDAVVMKDPVSRRSRGFGFITYSDIESLEKALDEEPHTIDGRMVEAKRAVPHSKESQRGANALYPPAPGSGPSGSSNNINHHHHHEGSISGDGNVASLDPSGAQGDPASAASAPASALHGNSHDEYAYNKIFVGGLHYETRDPEFKAYFSKFGKIISAEVMYNRETHKARGFGFVVFEQERFAEAVCQQSEHIIDKKVVEVKRAIPRSKIGGGALGAPHLSQGHQAQTLAQVQGQGQGPVVRPGGNAKPPPLSPGRGPSTVPGPKQGQGQGQGQRGQGSNGAMSFAAAAARGGDEYPLPSHSLGPQGPQGKGRAHQQQGQGQGRDDAQAQRGQPQAQAHHHHHQQQHQQQQQQQQQQGQGGFSYAAALKLGSNAPGASATAPSSRAAAAASADAGAAAAGPDYSSDEAYARVRSMSLSGDVERDGGADAATWQPHSRSNSFSSAGEAVGGNGGGSGLGALSPAAQHGVDGSGHDGAGLDQYGYPLHQQHPGGQHGWGGAYHPAAHMGQWQQSAQAPPGMHYAQRYQQQQHQGQGGGGGGGYYQPQGGYGGRGGYYPSYEQQQMDAYYQASQMQMHMYWAQQQHYLQQQQQQQLQQHQQLHAQEQRPANAAHNQETVTESEPKAASTNE